MTSPVRNRRDRSRRRIAAEDATEIVAAARRLIDSQPHGDSGANLSPPSRGDCAMIASAVRRGWDIPETKRVEIIARLAVALDSDDDRLAVSAARVLLVMQATTLGDGG